MLATVLLICTGRCPGPRGHGVRPRDNDAALLRKKSPAIWRGLIPVLRDDLIVAVMLTRSGKCVLRIGSRADLPADFTVGEVG